MAFSADNPNTTTKIDGARMNPRCCVSPKTVATQAAGGLSSQSGTRACHRQSPSLRCGSARSSRKVFFRELQGSVIAQVKNGGGNKNKCILLRILRVEYLKWAATTTVLENSGALAGRQLSCCTDTKQELAKASRHTTTLNAFSSYFC